MPASRTQHDHFGAGEEVTPRSLSAKSLVSALLGS
jgi:hypothetical protein